MSDDWGDFDSIRSTIGGTPPSTAGAGGDGSWDDFGDFSSTPAASNPGPDDWGNFDDSTQPPQPTANVVIETGIPEQPADDFPAFDGDPTSPTKPNTTTVAEVSSSIPGVGDLFTSDFSSATDTPSATAADDMFASFVTSSSSQIEVSNSIGDFASFDGSTTTTPTQTNVLSEVKDTPPTQPPTLDLSALSVNDSASPSLSPGEEIDDEDARGRTATRSPRSPRDGSPSPPPVIERGRKKEKAEDALRHRSPSPSPVSRDASPARALSQSGLFPKDIQTPALARSNSDPFIEPPKVVPEGLPHSGTEPLDAAVEAAPTTPEPEPEYSFNQNGDTIGIKEMDAPSELPPIVVTPAADADATPDRNMDDFSDTASDVGSSATEDSDGSAGLLVRHSTGSTLSMVVEPPTPMSGSMSDVGEWDASDAVSSHRSDSGSSVSTAGTFDSSSGEDRGQMSTDDSPRGVSLSSSDLFGAPSSTTASFEPMEPIPESELSDACTTPAPSTDNLTIEWETSIDSPTQTMPSQTDDWSGFETTTPVEDTKSKEEPAEQLKDESPASEPATEPDANVASTSSQWSPVSEPVHDHDKGSLDEPAPTADEFAALSSSPVAVEPTDDSEWAAFGSAPTSDPLEKKDRPFAFQEQTDQASEQAPEILDQSDKLTSEATSNDDWGDSAFTSGAPAVEHKPVIDDKPPAANDDDDWGADFKSSTPAPTGEPSEKPAAASTNNNDDDWGESAFMTSAAPAGGDDDWGAEFGEFGSAATADSSSLDADFDNFVAAPAPTHSVPEQKVPSQPQQPPIAAPEQQLSPFRQSLQTFANELNVKPDAVREYIRSTLAPLIKGNIMEIFAEPKAQLSSMHDFVAQLPSLPEVPVRIDRFSGSVVERRWLVESGLPVPENLAERAAAHIQSVLARHKAIKEEAAARRAANSKHLEFKFAPDVEEEMARRAAEEAARAGVNKTTPAPSAPTETTLSAPTTVKETPTAFVPEPAAPSSAGFDLSFFGPASTSPPSPSPSTAAGSGFDFFGTDPQEPVMPVTENKSSHPKPRNTNKATVEAPRSEPTPAAQDGGDWAEWDSVKATPPPSRPPTAASDQPPTSGGGSMSKYQSLLAEMMKPVPDLSFMLSTSLMIPAKVRGGAKKSASKKN